MAQCPVCSNSIAVTEDNYGTLYRCEHCQAESFIGFDGVPENSKEPHPVESETNQAPQLAVNVMPVPAADEVPRDIFSIDSQDVYAEIPSQPMPSLNVDSPASQHEVVRNESGSGAFKNFAQDVQDFGNDSVTSGLLTFDIEISGIDLGEMKRDLLEALDDNRFGWNLLELTQQIKDGTLLLKNVSAPKIIVLVKRIMPIGLHLSWRHHVSTQ